MNTLASPLTQVLTPDFYDYEPYPLSSVVCEGGFVHVLWPDDTKMACYKFWLRENAVGQGGVDLATRECVLDPADLTDDIDVKSAVVDNAGNLIVEWAHDGQRSVYHSGWLRHIAENDHRPSSWLPEAQSWTTSSIGEVPRVDGASALESDDVILELLNNLMVYGACVLERSPTYEGYLLELAKRIGPVRDSNFGMLWDVKADIELAGDAKTNSTANTGLRLGPHSDLPTREIPPGFQFLHCLINDADGGESTLTDGAALVEALEQEHPEAFELLSTRHWIFFNRGPGIDHRWSAPIIDYLPGCDTPTIRAFYPVRAFPAMANEDVVRSYEALRLFHHMADQPQFELKFRLTAGDIMCFDNRRVLHGRDAFTGSGKRHLQGVYIDRDEIMSRGRALNRAAHSHGC
jgi:gamma-butyrobetaine dioxygenase